MTGLKGTLTKAKANAVQGIPELIKTAVNKSFKENMAEKHAMDAKFDRYRYVSRFALPVYNEYENIERYNVFLAKIKDKKEKNQVEKKLRHSKINRRYGTLLCYKVNFWMPFVFHGLKYLFEKV